MTLTTLELLYHTIDLAIPFLAANKWLKNIRVARRGVSTHSYYHREVSLSKLRRFELSSLAVKSLLVALRTPSTADLGVRVLPSGPSHTPLNDALPSFLGGIPGAAEATSLQYGATGQTLSQVILGSNPCGGAFDIQGFFNSRFPADFCPLSVSRDRELCLSEAHSVPHPLLGEGDRGALLVLFNRVRSSARPASLIESSRIPFFLSPNLPFTVRQGEWRGEPEGSRLCQLTHLRSELLLDNPRTARRS